MAPPSSGDGWASPAPVLARLRLRRIRRTLATRERVGTDESIVRAGALESIVAADLRKIVHDGISSGLARRAFLSTTANSCCAFSPAAIPPGAAFRTRQK